ncbi:FMN-binding protein [Psychromicrobium lacuslunae]|uniref:FMN-binding domain-containing protein n=1 Tax=Psychromicrobium lacuslunae TaxID=1618207 RepID=A0A0D4BYG3_9MICC|nr:hypothetical protein [Psychromicrobium lacuslunae]AJT41359.1 hypothetical protein UM93_07245 [Psychromicrobium lacuslunae]
MKITHRKSLFVSAAGIALIGGVAGCAPAATQSAPSTPASSSDQSSSSATTSSSSSSSGYKDGSYSADGNYTSPNGQETIGVKLTLSSGVVSELELTPHPSNPNTQKFQGEFISGINALVVGKKIDELNVSKVSGSSLTSGGFNQAIEEIKKEASS